MPTNKDFKRLVRARMQKTGEAYTTARRHLLAKRTTAPKPAAPSTDFAKLAGFSDATIKAKTGCNWARWVAALDYKKAHTWSHTEIATYVYDTYKIDGWWAQAVTVGYERIKGLRVRGQRRDGTYEASKSKMLPVPVARLYRAWSDAPTRKRWLADDLTIRTATRNKSMLIKWQDGTNVAVYFLNKGKAKSQVNVQHAKLDKDGQTRMRRFWQERLAALGEILVL